MRLNELTKSPKSVYKKSSIKGFLKNKELFSLALQQYKKGIIIYRGMPSEEDILFGNTHNMIRTSANTTNHYNILVSEMPNWSKYPKRNNSYICTTDIEYTDIYGFRFVVLPIGNPIIGICPDSDFWDSFKKINRLFNVFEMDAFNHSMREFYSKFSDELPPLSTESASDILKSLDLVQSKIPLNILDDGGITFISAKILPWVELSIKLKKKNQLLSQAVMSALDPNINNFRAVPLSKFPKTKKKEVWFSGQSYFVDPDVFNQLIKSGKL